MRAIVIGAGPAGLAAATCLKRVGIGVEIFDRADRIAAAWAHHYDRLHLHTSRARSGLPFMAMPKASGRYPPRAEVLAYMESYARHFGLAPQLDCAVEQVRRNGGNWQVHHAAGSGQADIVVFATGLNGPPARPDWPGLGDYTGEVLHSSAYRNPAPFAGKPVLVVGFGNSGAEIALDLAGAGNRVTLCVRGPVNLLPKEILGIPVTSLGLLRKLLPYRLVDVLTAPVVRALIGRPGDYGMRQADKGPLAQVIEDGRIPMIDSGALAEIRAGRIAVRPGIREFDATGVRFVDGSTEAFGAVILATGYGVDLRSLLPETPEVLDGDGRPLVSGGDTGQRGLYFCSYHAAPNGQLRQIGAEARAIAAHAATL